MNSDLDVYRSAQAIIKRYGEDAALHAAMRADEMLATGDVEGQAIWKRIVKAIQELIAKERPQGTPLH